MNKNTPLITIVVITYNSSKYIVDTLDSIYKQNYQNIELIVSDDCSTDDTILTIKEWLNEYRNRFIHSELIETPKNTGVSPNINRGIKKASGEWIKIVSGDDKLFSNAITDYVDYILDKPECSICFAKFHFWGDDSELVQYYKDIYEKNYYPYLKADWKRQWKRIQKTLFVPGPGLFYKRKLLEEVGGFDERFPFADEYPITYNILEKGYRIYFIDKELYDYQIRKESLCRTELGLHPRVFKSQYNYIRTVYARKVIRHGYLLYAFDNIINYYILSLDYKNKSKFYKRIVWCIKFLSPLSYVRKIKFICNKINW